MSNATTKCRNSVVLMVLLAAFAVSSARAQNLNPPYPRVFFSAFADPPVEWVKLFDMVRCGTSYSKLKGVNPSVITTTSRDWNVWEIAETVPEEWYVRDSNGTVVKIGYGKLMDFSDYCTPSTRYGNKKYNEYLITATVEQTLSSPYYDGFSCQGVWEYPWGTTNVDLDKNGVNDWDEHGKDWLISTWQKGVRKTVAAVYEELSKKGKVLRLNSGQFHNFCWTTSNGLNLEHAGPQFAFDWNKQLLDNWMSTAPAPHLLTVGAEGNTKNSFQDMRGLLGYTLLGDGYFSFTDKQSGEHNYKRYYDEFDLDLGYPKSSAKRLSNGCYVRFFDKGVSIVNPTGASATVTDGQLRAYVDYAGPYYRFRGGQDPNFNNGSLFSEVTLRGEKGTYGVYLDGIILLKEPKTVVADIFIDDAEGATSPSNVTPVYTGTWVPNGESGDEFWCMAFKPYLSMYKYAYTQPGAGTKNAQYKANIGVPGNYEIFEWHGYIGLDPDHTQEATNVPFTVTFSRGATAQGFIDQSVLYGQWNSLGTYYLEKGTASNVSITDKADGIVIADAFKFVYVGSETDNTHPNSPRELRAVNRTENLISLRWLEPLNAPDGDVASAYQVFRNGSLIATPITNSYIDTELLENRSYTYAVYAVDNVGLRSSNYISGTFSTLPDTVPPRLISVTVLDEMLLDVLFSEPLEQSSAENTGNYAIETGVNVYSAQLQSNLKNVRLTTSEHTIGAKYTLFLSGIKDRALLANTIAPNSSLDYIGGSGDTILVRVSADNDYEIWINGVYLGKGDSWNTSETWSAPSIAGKNVVAVKAFDRGGEASIVAEIDFVDQRYVSNETWKVSTVEEAGWESVAFNDVVWQKASSYGLHGVALPWKNYSNVKGISTTNNVHWIWTSDYINDDVAYFRFVIGSGGDSTPPNPPTGVAVRNK